MHIEDRLARWQDSLQMQGCSKNTILAYMADVRFFAEYCAVNKLDFKDVEASDLRSYLVYLIDQRQISHNSTSRHLTSIRAFMSWAVKAKLLEVDNVQDVSIKKLPRRLPNMLDIETVNQILDQPAPETEAKRELWLRDKAMLELFYSSGLRLSELQNIRYKDLDFQRQSVRVVGKGNKERIVPLGSKAIQALRLWFDVYRVWVGELTAGAYVFITQKGEQISVKQIERRVKYHAKRAGVREDVYPHLLRHCFATHMLMNCGDIRSVQEMLGHSNIATTQIYTNLDLDYLMGVYDKTHPRSLK